MGFGTLAHVAGKLPLKELTDKLANRGLDFVQLAPAKAIGDIDLGPGRLSPGLANFIAEQFDRAGIRIGVLGCYIDAIHPDPERRRSEVRRFKEHLRHARDFGAAIVATETGGLTTFQSQDPVRYEEIGWKILHETIEELAEEAERWGVTVGIEPVSCHTLSSADKMARMLQEVPSSTLGVVFDPVNLLNADTVFEQDALIDRAFSVFGDRIVLAHLKDYTVRNGELKAAAPYAGGEFHTDAFLGKLKRHKPYIDISSEELTDATLEGTIQRVRAGWEAV